MNKPVDNPNTHNNAAVTVEVIALDELTPEEQRDRLHLERVIERSFYEAGKALRELRDTALAVKLRLSPALPEYAQDVRGVF